MVERFQAGGQAGQIIAGAGDEPLLLDLREWLAEVEHARQAGGNLLTFRNVKRCRDEPLVVIGGGFANAGDRVTKSDFRPLHAALGHDAAAKLCVQAALLVGLAAHERRVIAVCDEDGAWPVTGCAEQPIAVGVCLEREVASAFGPGVDVRHDRIFKKRRRRKRTEVDQQ